MFRFLLNFFRPKRDTESVRPTGSSYSEFVAQNQDTVVGYRFSATLAPETPLSYLRRHGQMSSSIPPGDSLIDSPLYCWTAQMDAEFDFLDRGATMSSSVGYVPTDGGDFLPFLIRFREIVEAPRNPKLREFDDVFYRVAAIRKIKAGYGYASDADFNIKPLSKRAGRGDYHEILSQGNPEWLPMFVLRELSGCECKGLVMKNIQTLHVAGYGSLREVLEAPDRVLLDLPGIGPKRLATIRANRSTK